MVDHPYEYVLEFWRKSRDVVLGRVAVEVDWVPVREALIFDLLRRGAIEQPGGLPAITVEPIWDEQSGAPTLIGFRAALKVGNTEASRIFTTTYFGAAARRVASGFVERGDLKEGETFEYGVLAIARRAGERGGERVGARFSVTPREVPMRIKRGSIGRLMGGALLLGTENAHDVPAFFHWRVLEEASILTRKAGSMETGGILIGHVCRDVGLNEMFVEVTAVIAAEAKGELTRLSFTPDTWTKVQAAVDRRGREEVWIGWFHSHSFYHERGEKTGVDDAPGRQIARPFLSEHDRLLHRACFPRAYGLALLVTDSPQSGMSWTTFGWRSGDLARRAFHVIGVPLPAGFELQGEGNESNREHIVR